LVQQVVQEFEKHDHFLLAMSPEGTRKKVERLKTGFYHIANEANVPILPVGFDFLNKEVVVGTPLYPKEETEDMKYIISFLSACRGKHPEKGL
jgi:1-acyl-sn-glycerol-3-phosphate acyltransferase